MTEHSVATLAITYLGQSIFHNCSFPTGNLNINKPVTLHHDHSSFFGPFFVPRMHQLVVSRRPLLYSAHRVISEVEFLSVSATSPSSISLGPSFDAPSGFARWPEGDAVHRYFRFAALLMKW